MKKSEAIKDNMGLNYPSFWLNAWQEHRNNSLRSRRIKGQDEVNFWNAFAEKMKRWSKEERSISRVQKVLQWIGQQGIQISDMRILDIGAGTGSFAIPFSKAGGQVTALEPAEKLVEILRDNMKGEGVRELSIITDMWEDINPKKEGIEGGFDLVFASLTPAIHDKDTLEKMITCSRKWCFLCEFAGRRRNRVQEELWNEIFMESMPLPEYNIFYPLNYLYSKGYCPSLQLWREQWEEEASGEEAVENLTRHFSLYTKITPEVRRIICDYVAKHLQEGIFREEFQSLLGMTLWNVNDMWGAF
ncbi:methyltransferase domain-containing protein [Candidatus Contubernalis alkaliaceticus]|uniref:methyltransferase domain-containing protein n=1 Tax=Candidatus Contubernalis alkaliaceticus TaxID=338645 RepID=UPI001F4BE003|nr:methyltransferase domain-containing protein [Candidatus Contubernalis alkalaceticus]UNC93006.1 methyltransferase domain-containing protein [Candidatus Contubernalis alkalaceticus]